MQVSYLLKTVLILLLILSTYFYLGIFNSNLNFEINNRQLSNSFSNIKESELILDKNKFELNKESPAFVMNTREKELALRIRLLLIDSDNGVEIEALKSEYKDLLSLKPAWPYFFSGLLQLNQINHGNDFSYIEETIQYGPFETKIVKSIAEVLFYRWNELETEQKLLMLEYLSEQSGVNISNSIQIAAKFGQINSFCDYLYEKHKQQNVNCINNYWKPLISELKN